MLRLNDFIEMITPYLTEFIEWFLLLPMYIQILVIVGIVAALILTGILVYYLLKGVVYLIYYIFKGLYLLFKYLAIAMYKLFEGLFYAITGNPRPIKVSKAEEDEEVEEPPVNIKQIVEYNVPIKTNVEEIIPNAEYCNECGSKFSDQMHKNLSEYGRAYCIYCGKGFRVTEPEIARN
jgi:hypothetical protein